MTVPATATDIKDALDTVLSAIERAALEQAFDLPSRRYTTFGGSVFDCEQVSVAAMESGVGVVGDPNPAVLVGPCSPTWNLAVEAAIVVCAVEATTGPRGQILPTPEAIETDTLKASQMFDVLRHAVDDLVNAGAFGRLSASFVFGQPQGGMLAVVCSLNVNLWV